MRLYMGKLLQAIRYNPAYGDRPATFNVNLFDGTKRAGQYENESLEGLINEVKNDGHQVWGKNPLGYSNGRPIAKTATL